MKKAKILIVTAMVLAMCTLGFSLTSFAAYQGDYYCTFEYIIGPNNVRFGDYYDEFNMNRNTGKWFYDLETLSSDNKDLFVSIEIWDAIVPITCNTEQSRRDFFEDNYLGTTPDYYDQNDHSGTSVELFYFYDVLPGGTYYFAVTHEIRKNATATLTYYGLLCVYGTNNNNPVYDAVTYELYF